MVAGRCDTGDGDTAHDDAHTLESTLEPALVGSHRLTPFSVLCVSINDRKGTEN